MKNKPVFFLLVALLFFLVVLVFSFFYFRKNPQLLSRFGIAKNSIIENTIAPKPTAQSVSKVLENSQEGKTVTQKELTDIQKALEANTSGATSVNQKNKSTTTSSTNSTNAIQNALSEQNAAKLRADINNILSTGN